MDAFQDLDNLDHRLWHRLEHMQILAGRYARLAAGDRFARGRDASRGQGRVLKALKLVPEITQKDLMELLDMRQQSLAELLGKLEVSGLIEREPSKTDRRKQVVRLTEAGRQAANAIPEAHSELAVFDCLTPEEKVQFEDYVVRLSNAFEAALGDRGGASGPFPPRPPHGPMPGGPRAW